LKPSHAAKPIHENLSAANDDDARALDGAAQAAARDEGTRFRVLAAISFSHFLNDMIQSLIVAIYPLLKGEFSLSFTQIGAITLTYQFSASVLQPLVGLYTDKYPKPHSLSIGMGSTLIGLITLALAPSYPIVLIAAALIGTGSAVFHPESSRIARLASGGRHGLAQSIFQVGGNAGGAVGPLLVALIVIPHGRPAVAWFALAALLAIAVLWQVSNWYRLRHLARPSGGSRPAVANALSSRRVIFSIGILLLLLFSKYFYMASIQSFYSFYLIQKFGVSVRESQIYLFMFLLAGALGGLMGGPIGDRVGRKQVIWFSILGVAPFTLLLPHVGLVWTAILSVAIAFIISSAFSAILVFAQELMPGKVGAVSGLFFGFAFGMGGIGAAVLGGLADHRGIEFVYRVCAFLPLLGISAALLPDLGRAARRSRG
jgi:MFS transporter, FSR family, fosmidomycin resistance protein